MKVVAIAAVSIMLFNVGCQNTNSVESAQPVGRKSLIASNRVITDSTLNDVAGVVEVRQATVSGDILRIEVDVFNNRRSQERFNYMFEWYDLNGMKVETPLSTWRSQNIGGKETVTLIGVAPTPNAKDFKIKFQKSKI